MNPSLGWLQAEIKKIYKAKNQSVFPKLNFMVRSLGIDEEIQLRWLSRSEGLLRKKGDLVRRGKFSMFRYE